MIATTPSFTPIKHTHFARACVEKYDFHQGNHYLFGDNVIPVRALVNSRSREKIVAVILNHKDKIFFIGRTTSAPQYIYNYGRFFATRDAVGVSTHVRDTYSAANKDYWSIEFLKATPATEKLVAEKLKDWRRLGGYVHTDQPDTRNLIRVTHTATGWSGFFTMADRIYINDGAKRWAPLRDITSRMYQQSLVLNRDLVKNDLMHEHKLITALVARDAQSGVGFSFKIVESTNNPDDFGKLSTNASAFNGVYYAAWAESSRVRDLAKHFGLTKETSSIGVYPSNVPAPASVQLPDPFEFVYKPKLEPVDIPVDPKVTYIPPASEAPSTPGQYVIDPTSQVSDVISIRLPDPVEVGKKLLARMHDEATKVALVVELLAAECGIGVNAFSTAIAEVISSSTLLCTAVGNVSASEIESTILAGTLPEIANAFTYLETISTAAKAVHQTITTKETAK